jgi:3-oxoadipate enol-lactonase
MNLKPDNGATIYYTENGDKHGLPLVLIHGFPFNLNMWDGLAAQLPPHIRSIRYDVRGHGRSEPGDGQYTIEFFVDDLISLLDKLELKQVVVCGLSMGGYVALRAIERDPERFSAIILCDTRSEADTDEGKIKRAEAIKKVKANGVVAYSEEFVKNVFTENTLKNEHGIVEELKKIIQTNTETGICGTLLALAARTDTSATLEKIKVPALIMVGEEDKLTPPSASEAMHKKIKGSKLVTIPHAAHISNFENPELFNTTFINFLEEINQNSTKN